MTDPTEPVKEIRVGVGTPDAAYSSVWTMWVRKSDVYLTARGMAGLVKVSLHKSGDWRIAETSEASAKLSRPLMSTGQRIILGWQRPSPFTIGWTKAVTVVVPHMALRVPMRVLSAKRDEPSTGWSPHPLAARWRSPWFCLMLEWRQANGRRSANQVI